MQREVSISEEDFRIRLAEAARLNEEYENQAVRSMEDLHADFKRTMQPFNRTLELMLMVNSIFHVSSYREILGNLVSRYYSGTVAGEASQDEVSHS